MNDSAGAPGADRADETPSEDGDRPGDGPPMLAGEGRASRLWRSIWRTHFYAGLIAAPILVLLAVTGLVILYTEPFQQGVEGDLHAVEVRDEAASLEDQLDVVVDEYPGYTFASVTPGKERDHATRFGMTDQGGGTRTVYVDPYGPEVIGERSEGAGLVGLANRLHGNLNNETFTIPLPAASGILGDEPLLQDVAVGDVVVEIFAGWGLILAFTGIYLWLPRKRGTGKALFVPRLRKAGRARWRDLHAVAGVVLSSLLVFLIVTGLPWSASWGSTWGFLAAEVTPNEAASFWDFEVPASAAPTVGDLDREGHRVPWAAGGDHVPTSGGSHHGGDTADPAADDGPPADPVTLDLVARAADEEGMRSGYTIYPPTDVTDDPEAPAWGSYTVTNPWPGRMSDQGAVYLDQFTGETISHSTPETWGRLQWLTEWGIETHMGTNYGLVTRILMTGACLLLLWNVTTAMVMWNKRRRKGTLGLPRRPVELRIQRVLGISALVLAVIYPLWGLTLLAVLLLDRYLVRRVSRLRVAFGMR